MTDHKGFSDQVAEWVGAAAGHEVVVQPRCPHCLDEHYSGAVWAISHGYAACGRCHRVPPVFATVEDYRAMLRKTRMEGSR